MRKHPQANAIHAMKSDSDFHCGMLSGLKRSDKDVGMKITVRIPATSRARPMVKIILTSKKKGPLAGRWGYLLVEKCIFAMYQVCAGDSEFFATSPAMKMEDHLFKIFIDGFNCGFGREHAQSVRWMFAFERPHLASP